MNVGDVVDNRYLLLELLGEGAAGKVFRAEDHGAGNRLIALKLLHAKDPRWENFFRREFEVLSRLRHKNLVQVYDFGPAPEENTYYFTQELVVGKPLLDIVYGKKVDEVAGLFIEICRALEFIHGHGVLHRDLKPANILVQRHAEPGERVRVLDFGLWRELDPTPQRGARWAGTPPYLASEVLRGFGHSICADLYAVGVTLFQAVTRKLPHGRGTPQELLQARKKPAPNLHGVVTDPLAALIGRLLEEEAGKRPQSAAEVAAALSVLVPDHSESMPLELGLARLVGRDAEFERVKSALEKIKSGQPDAPRLIVVGGPSGVGKSRFVDEIKASVQLEGGRSAIGRCIEGVRWPYRPFAELIRSLAPMANRSALPVAQREVIDRLCPELSREPPRSTEGWAEGDQGVFRRAAVDLFLGLSKAAPCVVVVEDIHHGDEQSIGLLSDLISRSAEQKLAVVVTGTGHAATWVPNDVLEASRGRVLFIELTSLSRDDVVKLLAALLGVPEVPIKLVDTIMAHAGGNPLVVEELMSLFIERGDLRRGPSGWLLDEFDSAAIAPAPLIGVLRERLDELDELEECALCALAVFNRPAGPKLIAAISGLDIVETRQALQVAESAGLIRVVESDSGRPRVVFRHPQIRELLVERLSSGDGSALTDWHLMCAEVLDTHDRSRGGAMAETIAFHYEKGGQTRMAIKWLERACQYSLQTFAFDDAIEHAQRLVRLVDGAQIEPSIRIRCEVLQATTLFHAGKLPEARAFLESTLERSDPAADRHQWALLHLWLARVVRALGMLELGREYIAKAIAVTGEVTTIPRAVLGVARALLLTSDKPSAAYDEAAAACTILDHDRTREAHLVALDALSMASAEIGRAEEALDAAERALDGARRSDQAILRITAERRLAEILSEQGDRLGAREHLNRANDLARNAQHPLELPLVERALGDQLFVSGAYRDAITRYQGASTGFAKTGHRVERADAFRAMGSAYLSRGDYDRAVDHLRTALDGLEAAGPTSLRVRARCELAQALLSRGDVDGSEVLLLETAQRLAEEGLPRTRAVFLHARGSVDVLRGRFDAGRQAFLEGAVLARRCRDPYLLGQLLVGYAQLLLRFNRPTRAYRIAKRAEWLFTDLDARGQLKRLEPLINAAQGLSKR